MEADDEHVARTDESESMSFQEWMTDRMGRAGWLVLWAVVLCSWGSTARAGKMGFATEEEHAKYCACANCDKTACCCAPDVPEPKSEASDEAEAQSHESEPRSNEANANRSGLCLGARPMHGPMAPGSTPPVIHARIEIAAIAAAFQPAISRISGIVKPSDDSPGISPHPDRLDDPPESLRPDHNSFPA